MWRNLQAAIPPEDDHLTALPDSLPEVTLAGRAPSTSSKYSAIFNRWKLWTQEHHLPALPASPHHFALYLRHLMLDAKTASPIESAIHSVSWIHTLAGKPSPIDHPLVKNVLACAQHLLAHHTSKKEPITVFQHF